MPTKFGTLFLIIIFLSFIFSLSFGHSLSYFFSITLLSLFVVAAFISNNLASGITLHPKNKELIGHVGQEVVNELILGANSHSYFSVEIPLAQKEVFSRYDNVNNLKNYNYKSNEFKSTFSQRGHYILKNLLIKSTYPFGIFKTWKYLNADVHFYICSQLIELNISSVDSDIEARQYQEGDSLSRINWKRSARGNDIIVNSFEKRQLSELGEVYYFKDYYKTVDLLNSFTGSFLYHDQVDKKLIENFCEVTYALLKKKIRAIDQAGQEIPRDILLFHYKNTIKNTFEGLSHD